MTDVIEDLRASGESAPTPLSEKHYSGEFRVRIPPQVHRALAIEAAEQGVSLNRLASAKLAAWPQWLHQAGKKSSAPIATTARGLNVVLQRVSIGSVVEDQN